MGFLFFGFFFLFLDFPIVISGKSIDLLPTFLGCVLLLLGLWRIGNGEPRLLRMRLGAIALGALDLCLTVLSLCSVSMGAILATALDLGGLALSLYLAYETAEQVKAWEKRASRPLGGRDLSSAWFLLLFGSLLSILGAFVESIALLCVVLQLLSVIWYQMALYRAWRKIIPPKK